jgi:TonB family protein
VFRTGAFERRQRLACSWVVAFGFHLALFIAVAGSLARSRTTAGASLRELIRVEWRGGGGGGGNLQTDAPRQLRRAGSDAHSIPSAPARPAPATPDLPEPDPVDHVVIPVQPLGEAIASMPGKIDWVSDASGLSRGPGRGPGFGTGIGSGDGPGTGPGQGPGTGGGFGDGVYQAGPGITMPVVVHVEKPRYTNDAMRARQQGVVWIECVVRPNGVCTDIRVVRSLDTHFGLDEEARRAAALWRFRPGTYQGRPVPVAVRIELEFSVR